MDKTFHEEMLWIRSVLSTCTGLSENRFSAVLLWLRSAEFVEGVICEFSHRIRRGRTTTWKLQSWSSYQYVTTNPAQRIAITTFLELAYGSILTAACFGGKLLRTRWKMISVSLLWTMLGLCKTWFAYFRAEYVVWCRNLIIFSSIFTRPLHRIWWIFGESLEKLCPLDSFNSFRSARCCDCWYDKWMFGKTLVDFRWIFAPTCSGGLEGITQY